MNSKAVQKLTYPIALILSTTGKKTCEALAKIVNKSGDTLLRLLEHNCVTFEDLLSFACKFFTNDDLHLIIDDTLISKVYSEVIEGTSDNYDSSNNSTYRSLCSVTAMLTNGKYALPIDTKMWIAKEVAQDQYKTKSELAQELILRIKDTVTIKLVIMDGLYCNENMIRWLNNHGLHFEMRFYSNRPINYKEEKSVPVRDCKHLRLKGKHSTKTIAAYWKGIPLYITAVKRECKNGKNITIYQVSNYRMQARQHKRIYGYRWHIEKFFRTAKQSLGLNHCQSRKLGLQVNHIRNVFFDYAILQVERKKRKLPNAEAALRILKHKSYTYLLTLFSSADQIFGVAYA